MRVSASSAPSGSSSARICGLADQRAGQRHALLLAAGQHRRPVAGAIGEADLAEHVERALAAPRRRAAMPVSPTSTLSTTRAQGSSRGSWNMMRVRRAAARRRRRASSVPAVGWSSPASSRSSVLLPQPLLPMIGEELPGRHVEVDAVEHDLVAEALADAAEVRRRSASDGRRATRAAGAVVEGRGGGDGRCGHRASLIGVLEGRDASCSEQPLEQPGEAVGELAEQRVDQDRQHDDVDQQELARLHRHVAEAGRGRDRLGDDQRQPHDAERIAQADEDRRQRAGQDHADGTAAQRLMP